MKVTVDIPEEQLAKVTARAEHRGVSVEEYAQSVMNVALATRDLADPDTRTVEERLASWREFVNTPRPYSPPLSDEAISRESMYPDRW